MTVDELIEFLQTLPKQGALIYFETPARVDMFMGDYHFRDGEYYLQA